MKKDTHTAQGESKARAVIATIVALGYFGIAFAMACGSSQSDARGSGADSGPGSSGGPPCETTNGWKGKETSGCQSCITAAYSDGGACINQSTQYSAACSSSDGCYVMCDEAPDADKCSCERGCDSQSCQTLFDGEMSCILATCASSCS